jgi:hypothetical protein
MAFNRHHLTVDLEEQEKNVLPAQPVEGGGLRFV